jgi:glycine/D-amino acid oxidase-like deaminating enzyme
LSRSQLPDPGAARSLWLQEALAHEAGDPCPPLTSNVAADVCVVGGGFAGLWTAVALTEREPAMRIVLLEQDIVGGGASGRNGGFFASSWWDLRALVGLFGAEAGVAYAVALADTIGEAGRFVQANGIDCWFHRDGTLFAPTGAWQLGGPKDETVAVCERYGVGDRVRRLAADEARGFADSPRFVAGTFDRDGAVVQPARLARGLRRVLLERGVRIFERTKLSGIDPSIPAVARTGSGAVRADRIVLTTGSWAASWPAFRRSFGIIVDYVVATEPVPARLEEIGWTSHAAIADGRDLLYYLRTTDDGRIVIGGGGLGAAFDGAADSRAVTHDRRVAEAAAQGLLWLFPQLKGTRFTHAWGGPIDQTTSFLPFYRTLAPGNVHAGLGYSGHGLAQTMVGGKILASTALGVDDEWTRLPVNRPEIAKAPPEPFRWPLIKAAAWALERGDRREDAGRPRGRLLDLVGSAPATYRELLVHRGVDGRRRAQ